MVLLCNPNQLLRSVNRVYHVGQDFRFSREMNVRICSIVYTGMMLCRPFNIANLPIHHFTIRHIVDVIPA
jgi:hypothetical protein